MSAVVGEIEEARVGDVGSRGSDVADVSAIELLPIDVEGESVVCFEVLEVGVIELFVEVDGNRGARGGGISGVGSRGSDIAS